MLEAHKDLGELVVIVFFGLALASMLLAGRQGLPSWLASVGHALLGVQIILGIYLIIKHPHAVSWLHPLFAALAVVCVAAVVPLRKRFSRNAAMAMSTAGAGICAVVALAIAMAR